MTHKDLKADTRTPINQPVPNLAQRTRCYFEELQERICAALEHVDGEKRFSRDVWERNEGGGGVARVLEEGAVFEKAGVNTSTVFGMMPESLAQRMHVDDSRRVVDDPTRRGSLTSRPEYFGTRRVEPCQFFATGVSLVIHPRNPMVPAVHANFRYFEQDNGDAWFGGGTDLTPYYPYDEDAIHFHSTLKRACDTHDREFYPRFKKWSDEYFFIKHRGETRGLGGIFFDYLRGDTEKYFAFVQSVGNSFLETYLPIVHRRREEPWGEAERAWQLVRRGRYVEFNLVYDRGTIFGLETRGRTESILMSLPPRVHWRYDHTPIPGTREAYLVELLMHPKDWV